MDPPPIRAYWWNSGPGRGNFGDLLTPLLCERLSGRKVVHADIHAAELIAVGSVLEPHFLPRSSWDQYRGSIWGAGRMFGTGVPDLSRADVRAVRGRLTLERIRCQHPEGIVLGDPGLLCFLFARSVPRRYKLGVIPHLAERGHPRFAELFGHSPDVQIIDICAGVQEVIDRVSQCEHILSSALHGLVLADALGIPNRWLRLDLVDEARFGKPPFKYQDYYSAFGLTDVAPIEIAAGEGLDDILERFGRWDRRGLDAIQRGLLAAFPFS